MTWAPEGLYISSHGKVSLLKDANADGKADEEEIIAQGYDDETVRKVLRLVRNAEFKRKQAAPVLKVTSRAFGTGWRMPSRTTGR